MLKDVVEAGVEKISSIDASGTEYEGDVVEEGDVGAAAGKKHVPQKEGRNAHGDKEMAIQFGRKAFRLIWGKKYKPTWRRRRKILTGIARSSALVLKTHMGMKKN